MSPFVNNSNEVLKYHVIGTIILCMSPFSCREKLKFSKLLKLMIVFGRTLILLAFFDIHYITSRLKIVIIRKIAAKV